MATPRGSEHRDLEQRFRNLEQRLRELAAVALRRPKFEVSAGDLTISGGDLVVDGGDFLLLDTDGSTVFRLGPQEHGDRGVSLSREDGSLALAVRKGFENVPQTIEIRDADGNTLLAEESLGNGLSRPILHIPMQPVQATAAALLCGPYGWEVPCAATSFTTTHQAWYARGNQFGFFRLRIAASDTTTAAEVKVINALSGDHLGAFLAGGWTGVRAAGSTGYTEVTSPALFLPGLPNESGIELAVQVRRTAGAGTLQVALPESRGA